MTGEPAKAPTLLVVDDDPAILVLVDRIATDLGFTVVRESDGRAALASLPLIRPDGAIVDVGLADIDGLSLLREIKAADPQSQVILMTGSGSIDSAVGAIKAGALDYISKPFDVDRLRELLITVRKSLERRETLMRIDADVARQFEFYGLIGRSPSMQELFDSVRRFAPYARTVLVTGETGTGKELVAKALHHNGPRKDKPFVSVNCSALTETLLESELFGHVRGSFTGADRDRQGIFEQADGGSVFLDEVQDMSPGMQRELLRVLQEGEVRRVGGKDIIKVDVRVISATNKNLGDLVKSGAFRQDLYYRLNVVAIELPPLRERKEDIPLIVQRLLEETRTVDGRTVKVEKDAMRAILRYDWPGNVRQLQNFIEKTVLLIDGDTIKAEHVKVDASEGDGGRAAGVGSPSRLFDLRYEEAKNAFSKDYLKALEYCTHYGQELYTGVFYENPAPPPTFEAQAQERQRTLSATARPRAEILEAFLKTE